jgi:hypothetical protein
MLVLLPFICFTQEKSSEQAIVDSMTITSNDKEESNTENKTNETILGSFTKESLKIKQFAQEIEL